MNVTGYNVLEEDNLPRCFKEQPQCVKCVLSTAALLAVSLAAIGIGAVIGYTYCYVEYKSGIVKKNQTQNSMNVRIMPIPLQDPLDSPKRTINGALSSTFLLSKIIQICRMLMDQDSPDNLKLANERNKTQT